MNAISMSRSARKLAVLVSAGAAALIASPAYADVTYNWAPTTWDVASSDFNNASQTVAPIFADSLTFNFTPGYYQGGGYFHNHGNGTGFTINAVLNGVNTQIFNSGPLSNGDFGLNSFGTISFAAATVTGISLHGGPINQAFHNFTADQTFTLGAAIGVVPEPGTWMVLILGFGAIGAAMRKAKQQAPAVRYA